MSPTKAYFAARRRVKRRAGVCHDCADPAEPGRTRCRRCLDRAAAANRKHRALTVPTKKPPGYWAAWYAAKKARGECRRCKAPVVPGRTRCPKHLSEGGPRAD